MTRVRKFVLFGLVFLLLFGCVYTVVDEGLDAVARANEVAEEIPIGSVIMLRATEGINGHLEVKDYLLRMWSPTVLSGNLIVLRPNGYHLLFADQTNTVCFEEYGETGHFIALFWQDQDGNTTPADLVCNVQYVHDNASVIAISDLEHLMTVDQLP